MLFCDPAEARTQDPQIKSLLLYQLSYGVNFWKGKEIVTILPMLSLTFIYLITAVLFKDYSTGIYAKNFLIKIRITLSSALIVIIVVIGK